MSPAMNIGPGCRPSQPAMLEPELEAMPRERLADLQLARLRKILQHVYRNVPFYQRRLEEAGVSPDSVRSLDDVVKIPFTSKSDLRANYPLGLLAMPREQLVRIHASSGTTTGRPTVVGYSREDLETWAELMARSLTCAGVRPGDIVQNAFGYGLFTGGLGVHQGAERRGCTVIPTSGGNTPRQVTIMRDLRTEVLTSTPSYALHIAEVAEKEGVDLRGGPLRLGVFGAEPWSEAMRIELQARLGITAVDLYGLSEIMGPGVAVECQEVCSGMHGWEDHFLFELIDPETGKRVPEGERGELVITTLTKQALPMIRYRSRDITTITTDPCACGRTHLRIFKFAGRSDDMLIIRGVNLYPSQVEDVLLEVSDIAPHYQLVVTRDGALDNLLLEVEAAPGASASAYARIAAEVKHNVKSKSGVTCRVEVKPPAELPRSEGKAVRVRDLRHL